MPEIWRFYGVIIQIYLIDREHPPRHIHIKYGEHMAVMELANLNLSSAQIDPDWGCLEFCAGAVDIAPATLYRYAVDYRDSEAA